MITDVRQPLTRTHYLCGILPQIVPPSDPENSSSGDRESTGLKGYTAFMWLTPVPSLAPHMVPQKESGTNLFIMLQTIFRVS